MRGAIDVGSNSIRLLVIDDYHNLIEQKVAETRLGDGFREGSITSGAMARTIDVIETWQQDLAESGCKDISIFATSAVRDAVNREEFCQLVKNRLSLDLRILSGEEEAWYSFSGAVGGFNFPQEECLLIDIGGGSTELAMYQQGHLYCCSMPLGAVRWKVMAYSRGEVKKVLARKINKLDLTAIKRFIAVGGTATTAAAIRCKVADYHREAIHGRVLTSEEIRDLEADLSDMTLAERKNVVGLPEARADIIVFGLSLLDILCELMAIDKIIVSDWGILDGYLDAVNP